MTHGKLGTVLIVDKDGILDAILSDGDLRRALMREDFDLEEPAMKFATLHPKEIGNKEMLAVDALALIEKYKIQLLAVVENGVPVGVFTHPRPCKFRTIKWKKQD